ncbi:uncharacterized protein BKA78DRAFT_324389 [Phyllosticta capitalensis]|uniref:uncharacterized protein n=1 Tax=Phyllosticta capitalensis TaxID=121624 RepID=UPI00312EA99C
MTCALPTRDSLLFRVKLPSRLFGSKANRENYRRNSAATARRALHLGDTEESMRTPTSHGHGWKRSSRSRGSCATVDVYCGAQAEAYSQSW